MDDRPKLACESLRLIRFFATPPSNASRAYGITLEIAWTDVIISEISKGPEILAHLGRAESPPKRTENCVKIYAELDSNRSIYTLKGFEL